MASKYYTPDIEDIYAGYEFEFKPQKKERGLYWQMKHARDPIVYYDRWEKCIFAEWILNPIGNEFTMDNFTKTITDIYYEKPSFYDLSRRIKDGSIRTKHLDKKDIESLGWLEVLDGLPNTFVKKNYLLNVQSNIIKICKDNAGRNILFIGKCPSVNELKRIMKWIIET